MSDLYDQYVKVLVRMDRDGALLTYEAAVGLFLAPGDRVLAPLPWFLDNSSGRMDYPNGLSGTVLGAGTYDGRCVRITGRAS